MLKRTILVLVLVLGGALAWLHVQERRMREQDEAALAALLAEVEARGYGGRYADLQEAVGPLDPGRQARLHQWLEATGKVDPRDAGGLGWRLAGPVAPEAVRGAHEDFEDEARDLAALLDEGPLCLTRLGWPAEGEGIAVFAEPRGLGLGLFSVRRAARWYATEAALAEDPRPALDHLDRLHDAVARPGSLIDAMMAIAMDAERDDAYLALALAGALPPERVAAWTAEVPRATRLVADGFRAERLGIGLPMVRDLLGGGIEARQWAGDEGAGPWGAGRVPSAADGARYLRALVAVEAALREGTDGAEARRARETCDDLGPPFSLMLPNLDATLGAARGAVREGVLRRAAVRLATSFRETGGLPADEAAARRRLEGVSDATALHYARTGPAAFRLELNAPPAGSGLTTLEVMLGVDAARAGIDRRGAVLEVRAR